MISNTNRLIKHIFPLNKKRLVKHGIVGATVLSILLSLRTNNYDYNSIGAVRFTRAAMTVYFIGSNYNRNLYSRNLDSNSKEYEKIKSICDKQAAQRLLDLCCTNRGVYIKVGQHLATLDYVLPQEFVKIMKVLHSNAPPNTMEEVRRVIREELGKDPDEIFTYIDPEPLGVASLAQVHKATTIDGRKVAVKVQHPYVRGHAQTDMRAMEVLVHLAGWAWPQFSMQWLADETRKNIWNELDFQHEAKNAERLEKTFSQRYKWLKIPRVNWDLTTSRVLTMDLMDGGQVTDKNYIRINNIDPNEVTDKLGTLYSHMIFIDGFVHGDPHPGNILVKNDENGRNCDLILLDHGLYACLTEEFRSEYAAFWISLLNVDEKAMRKHTERLGIKEELFMIFACMVTGRSWTAVQEGLDKSGKMTTEEEKNIKQSAPLILGRIAEVLRTVDSQMLLILKTNDLLRGIEYTLGTERKMNSFNVMSKCCIRSVYQERIRQAKSKFERFRLLMIEYFVLFRYSLYYTIQGFIRSCF